MQVPFDADDDERRRRLLNVCLLTLAAVGLLAAGIISIAIPFGAAGDASEIAMLYGSIVLVLVALGGIFWLSKRHSKSATWLYLLLLFATAVVSDTPYYVVQGRTMVLFALPVVLASVLLSPFSSFIFAGMAMIPVTIFALQIDVVPNPGFLVLFIAAVIMALVMQNLDRVLVEWHQASRRLALVSEAGRLLATNLTLDEVLISTLHEACELLGVETASLWRLDRATGELICWQARDPNRSDLVGRRVPLGQGLVGWVAAQGEGVVVRDLQTDWRHFSDLDCLTAQRVHAALCLPLRVGARVIGVLEVVDTGFDTFAAKDAQLVEPLAVSAAVAIENARLYEETDRLRMFNEGIINGMQECILILDEYGRITFVNPRVEELLGFARVDLIGEHWSAIIEPAELESNYTRFAQVGEGISSKYETLLVSQTGRQVSVLVSSRPLRRDGRFGGMLAVVTDISAIKDAEEVLRRQAADLREQNAELDAYAHTVAHDLKNPLALIAGYADVLRADHSEMAEDKMSTYLGLISATAYKSCSIVDELLMLSEVRTGEVAKLPVNMGVIVAGVLDRMGPMAAECDAQMIAPDEGWPEVLGYGPWIEEVWINYVSNALKYGGAQPIVELGWDEGREGKTRFWVRDSGYGITPEQQTRLFQPFSRLHSGKVDGHGLGLSIVLRIIEKLDGEVGVESELGEGSTFYFTLLHDETQASQPELDLAMS